MREFLTFLNQPIVGTLLTLAIGGYLFSRITERKTRKDKIREQAISFLEEVGNDMNWILSRIFGRIRRKDFGVDATIDEKRVELFEKRFSVRIKSKAYLESKDFSEKYEAITFEISLIVKYIRSLSTTYDLGKVITDIQKHKERIAADWPLTEEELESKREPPWNELETWAEMIWNRATLLLSTNLEVVIK
jgi:hypothetical protein